MKNGSFLPGRIAIPGIGGRRGLIHDEQRKATEVLTHWPPFLEERNVKVIESFAEEAINEFCWEFEICVCVNISVSFTNQLLRICV